MKRITFLFIIVVGNFFSQNFNEFNNFRVIDANFYNGHIYYSSENKKGIFEVKYLKKINDTTTIPICETKAKIKYFTFFKNNVFISIDSSNVTINQVQSSPRESILVYKQNKLLHQIPSEASIWGFGIKTLVNNKILAVGSHEMGIVFSRQKKVWLPDTSFYYNKQVFESYIPIYLSENEVFFYVDGPIFGTGIKLFVRDNKLNWKLKYEFSFNGNETIRQFAYHYQTLAYSIVNELFITGFSLEGIKVIKKIKIEGYISSICINKNYLYFAKRDSNKENMIMRVNLKDYSLEKLFDVKLQSETNLSIIDKIVVRDKYLLLITDNEKQLIQPEKQFIKYIGKNLLIFKL